MPANPGRSAARSNCTSYVAPRVRATESRSYLGVRLLRSERWAADPQKSKISVRAQPFILKSGHISGSATLTWRCSAYQWFATLVRSIIERIMDRTAVSRRSRYKTWRQLTAVAIFYAITNDDRAFERLLNCQRRGFTGLLHHYKLRMDAKNRFLYDQALSGALWFELRGNPRVQSIKRTILEQYRSFEYRSYDSARERRERVNELSDPWIVKFNHLLKASGLPCSNA